MVGLLYSTSNPAWAVGRTPRYVAATIAGRYWDVVPIIEPMPRLFAAFSEFFATHDILKHSSELRAKARKGSP